MGDEKRRCIYPCAFGASRHFFCGAMCSCEDRHEGGCRCDAHREPATPPEPAALRRARLEAVAGPLDTPREVDASVLTPDLFEPLDAPEPDEAERCNCTEHHVCPPALAQNERDRIVWENAGRWMGKLEDLRELLRAAEARGRERGLEEAARECDQLAGIAERGPWPGRRHEYTSAAKRIRALRSGR